ncbi:hypothetical protein KSF_049420 [Reticulibacter mediterranei]|uniref:Methyltransferase type 11 domain-containing protein n=1 Tax=Reticulibacter mediterranei TaxID=2778369 RepID=A0A8J3INN2_9CHLR|nr:hypothetical protein KSF_049420 [Reticulibacter mediterranei]
MPYPEHTFDVLYNSYMFDLLAVNQFAPILAEFQRVLKPGGRLILLNMSKNRPEKTWFEALYATGWVGACRPVLLKTYVQRAGFEDVTARVPQKLRVPFLAAIWCRNHHSAYARLGRILLPELLCIDGGISCG